MKLSTKLLSAFLAVTLLLSLAGCGGKNEPAKKN